jgi:pyruvate decarboxylase
MDVANTVELHNDHTLIAYATYPGAGYQSLLPKLTQALTKVASSKNPSQAVVRTPHGGLIQNVPSVGDSGNRIITQDEFWPLWATFFQTGDVVLGEAGTSSFGLLDVNFPESDLLTQILWGSIGWATGATLGASIVAKAQGKRCILFTGDGSMRVAQFC